MCTTTVIEPKHRGKTREIEDYANDLIHDSVGVWDAYGSMTDTSLTPVLILSWRRSGAVPNRRSRRTSISSRQEAQCHF